MPRRVCLTWMSRRPETAPATEEKSKQQEKDKEREREKVRAKSSGPAALEGL